MSLRLPAMTAVVCTVVISSPVGYARPLANALAPMPQAPIGHLQPRARQFSPGSVPEQIEQQKMSAFDAEQRKLDEQLDKSLNICRCQ
ncbi:hypothetical protein [Bradyrhizobium sp. JYMT SZCCT0428]|uniref:hypothetical protein n=1 Tax=Bradyrhizobium sp. JYMT SZCCT0428 TaxID=2807673 RepID=UPI001BA5D1BA|nr:hypothetical protein [Bradyrhizobium sp. JYMT SZCCT0428]MBR1150428.1 hypothetical protein [Bradyrhizobium sp. JYMT SZCCT0428]